jgi:NAD+ kinase
LLLPSSSTGADVATVGLLVHHAQRDAARLARDAAAWLLERGHQVRMPETDAAVVGLEQHACSYEGLTKGLDLAISLGGDGTMLRTVDLVADADVPVLGVNLGHLGYLTEVEPAHLHDALSKFFAGEHRIEYRMRMAVDVIAEGVEPGVRPALNEAVLSRTPRAQMARVLVIVDDEPFTTYGADAMIVATPTGSTAYAWSAGGPLVAPSHEALLLTPVAAHMLFDRSLVLPPTACIRLEVADERPVDLSVDGRSLGTLGEGDAVVCTAAPNPARLVTFGSRSFLGILKAKFGLAER